ncbi:MAG: amino acid permease, partial [Alphaproteobacteria bacterium]|nr:amino acid permease [Alphaproteobacteria bacterium]
MKKQLSAISLLAGTAIGSGMLSLPLVLAKYGLLFGCAMMIAFIWVAYFSSIIRSELNIYSQSDFSLKDVGTYFSGKIASQIGSVSLKLLSYSLIAAYLHGLASLLNVFLTVDLKCLIVLI